MSEESRREVWATVFWNWVLESNSKWQKLVEEVFVITYIAEGNWKAVKIVQ